MYVGFALTGVVLFCVCVGFALTGCDALLYMCGLCTDRLCSSLLCLLPSVFGFALSIGGLLSTPLLVWSLLDFAVAILRLLNLVKN